MSLDDTAGMMRLFGSLSSTQVTEEGALSLSTFYGCVRVLAEGVAVLPWHTRRYIEKGSEVASDHTTYSLLYSQPNPFMTSFNFRELMVARLIMRGNFYAWIERDGANRPKAFWPQKNSEVSPVQHEGRLWYHTPAGMIPDYDMIHVAGLGFDGITGRSVIELQAEQLGITINAQKYGGDLFRNGATLGGILTNKTGTVYTKEQREQLTKAWYEGAHGQGNNHATKILGGGLEYQRISLHPEEAQFLETRKLGAVEICGMLRVPPHMVGILDRATFSNIEHQDIGFVKYSLMPWLKRIEQEFDRKIYREDERGKVYNSFNVNGLLKGDITSQTQHIQIMMDRGVYSINDALSFLGQNTIGTEGDRRLVQRNMVPLDRVDDTIKQESTTDNGKGNQVL